MADNDPARQLRDAATSGRALRRQSLMVALVLIGIVALTVAFIVWVGRLFLAGRPGPTTTSTTTTTVTAPPPSGVRSGTATTLPGRNRPPAGPQRPPTPPTSATTQPAPPPTTGPPALTQPPQATTTTTRPCMLPTIPFVGCPTGGP